MDKFSYCKLKLFEFCCITFNASFLLRTCKFFCRTTLYKCACKGPKWFQSSFKILISTSAIEKEVQKQKQRQEQEKQRLEKLRQQEERQRQKEEKREEGERRRLEREEAERKRQLQNQRKAEEAR